MAEIYLPSSAKLLDYALAAKSSARKGGSPATVTIKVEVADPLDVGFLLRDLAEIDRRQRNPYRPAPKGRAEQELAREIGRLSAPLQLTDQREG